MGIYPHCLRLIGPVMGIYPHCGLDLTEPSGRCRQPFSPGEPCDNKAGTDRIDEGAAAIAKAVRPLPRSGLPPAALVQLSLADNAIGPAGVKALGWALGSVPGPDGHHCNTLLTTLDLQGNR
eukprot:1099493-Prorocentrum_minimum.AAC.1